MTDRLPAEEWSVYQVSTPDGHLRLAVLDGSEEPPFLPGAARAHGGPFWDLARAVVEAVPTTRSDREGMYWQTKAEAAEAERAATRFLEGDKKEAP